MKPVSLELSSTPHYFYFNIIFEDRTKKNDPNTSVAQKSIEKGTKKGQTPETCFRKQYICSFASLWQQQVVFWDVNHSSSWILIEIETSRETSISFQPLGRNMALSSCRLGICQKNLHDPIFGRKNFTHWKRVNQDYFRQR